ncbi:60 kDa SS-A/Ro ribonucleoprotein-like [Sitophilus oryzae]|uniref:60 kDa SS-A/Ro ribonucleoprotein-like n=1 Tax=Sitophilus oryzae TaxID=7048 RepID=A0A6J2X933_SITOR|nr:60 kDa SS-A/Ro ribonucleoprotein-like [Sitophilus oryzae]
MTSSLSLEDYLRRIIYVNNTHNDYYVGDPDKYRKEISSQRHSTIDSAIENELKEVFSVLDAANSDKNLPSRSTIFMFLGQLLHHEKMTPTLKSQVTAKVLQLCQSDEDFFDFIKYYTQLRKNCKLPSSVEKIVKKYYTKKSSLELAQSFAQFNSLHTWTHKDLIKLAHVKPDTTLKDAVIKYILKKQPNDRANEEEQKVMDILRKTTELRSTTEAVNAVPLLAELKLTIKQVSPSLHQNLEVWSAAIENMKIQEILPHLEKLYKLGLLKPSCEPNISNQLINIFTSPDTVKASGVHPIEVFTYMKRLEKGGKPLDPKLVHHLQNDKKISEENLKKATVRTEAKCIHILNALHKCFNLACNNVSPTNKRYLVTIDVTDQAKKAQCMGNKALTSLEVAAAYTLVLLRVEKDVFIGTFKDDKVCVHSITKKISYADLLKKISAETSTSSMVWSSIDWATSHKKNIDVFVNFIDSHFFANFIKEKKREPYFQSITDYRKKMNVPNSKFLIFYTDDRINCRVVGRDEMSNVLDVNGFDYLACKVAESFSRGAFC